MKILYLFLMAINIVHAMNFSFKRPLICIDSFKKYLKNNSSFDKIFKKYFVEKHVRGFFDYFNSKNSEIKNISESPKFKEQINKYETIEKENFVFFYYTLISQIVLTIDNENEIIDFLEKLSEESRYDLFLRIIFFNFTREDTIIFLKKSIIEKIADNYISM